jgi:hypothetical protein
MFIPDPESDFFHPGSRVKKIPDPRNESEFLALNIFPKLSEKFSGMFIPDTGSGFVPSLIQGSKKHRIPNPDPQH